MSKRKYNKRKYDKITGLDKYGWNELHNAIYYGELNKIKKLANNEDLFIKLNKQLAKNAVSNNPKDHLYSLTTLHICCEPFETTDIEKTNKIYDIIVSFCVKHKLHLSLQPYTYQMNTPLHFACKNDLEYIAKDLIRRIIEINSPTRITTYEYNVDKDMLFRPNDFLVTAMNLIQDNVSILAAFMQVSVDDDNEDLKILSKELNNKSDPSVLIYPLDALSSNNRPDIMTKRAFIFDQIMTFKDVYGMYPIHDYAFDRKLNLIILLSSTKYVNQLDDSSRTALFYLFVIKYYKFSEKDKLNQREEKIKIFKREYEQKKLFYKQLFNTMELLCNKMDLNIFINQNDEKKTVKFFSRIIKIMPDVEEYHQALINCMLIIKERVLLRNDPRLSFDFTEIFSSVLSTYITTYQQVDMNKMALKPWLQYVKNRNTTKIELLEIDPEKMNNAKRMRVTPSGAERYIDYLQFYQLI